MKFIVLFLFWFCLSTNVNSQEKNYFDTNKTKVSKAFFMKKLLTELYDIKEVNNSDKYLISKFFFDKNEGLYKRIFESYSLSKEFDEQPILLIKFERKLQSLNVVPVCAKDSRSYHLASRQSNKRNDRFVKRIEKKDKVKVLYLHNEFNDEEKYKVVKRSIKDKNSIVSDFITPIYPLYSRFFLMIKPDGNLFFSTNLNFNKKDLSKLIENDNWDQFKNDLKKSELLVKNIGFFSEGYYINNFGETF